MRTNLEAYDKYQVFLNYPFDESFAPLADAIAFAVVAAGLIPICAYDLTAPDRPRLEMLVEVIRNCSYSVHDLSRPRGEGAENFARMNMPIEMGMALFHALHTQRREHRCVFFVSTPDHYRAFASDLAGLDPRIHNNEESRLLSDTYDWLRSVVPIHIFNSQPTVNVVDKFNEFRMMTARVRGSANGGHASHDEKRELMYQVCRKLGWWDWRNYKGGIAEFPEVPIAFRDC
jgi:hypothetical protein